MNAIIFIASIGDVVVFLLCIYPGQVRVLHSLADLRFPAAGFPGYDCHAAILLLSTSRLCF